MLTAVGIAADFKRLSWALKGRAGVIGAAFVRTGRRTWQRLGNLAAVLEPCLAANLVQAVNDSHAGYLLPNHH